MCPLECDILTLTLRALHGKNEVKNRWCPPWSEPGLNKNTQKKHTADSHWKWRVGVLPEVIGVIGLCETAVFSDTVTAAVAVSSRALFCRL